ncbi:integrase catalytic subunit, partial [Novosphingobium sp. Rr 2-17]
SCGNRSSVFVGAPLPRALGIAKINLDIGRQGEASSLHRCLQRHGISRLPKADREKPKKFKSYEIGYFHIDIAELRHEGGKAFLYVAVDRTSKLVFARIYRKATKLVAAGFLKSLIRTVPYRIHTVLTDNGLCWEAAAAKGQQVSLRRA